MSKFGDIKTAYNAFGANGSWGNVTSGLIYTCNAGWLDLGHLNPGSSRPMIGASNLWASIKNEGPAAMKCNCTMDGQLRAIDYGGLHGNRLKIC